MKKTIWLSAPLLVVATGALVYTQSRDLSPAKPRASSARTRNLVPLSLETKALLAAHQPAGVALEEGLFREAEALSNAYLDDPRLGESFSRIKAEALGRRGAKAEALNLYLQILRDPKAQWRPNSRDLALPLELAVSLGRADDADLIATRAIAHPGSQFFNDAGVQAPQEADTAKERLAYAYLAIGNDVWQSSAPDFFVGYAHRAQALLPNNLPVQVQLAYAYGRRNAPGDKEAAQKLLLTARSRAGGTVLRTLDSIADGVHVSLKSASKIERD